MPNSGCSPPECCHLTNSDFEMLSCECQTMLAKRNAFIDSSSALTLSMVSLASVSRSSLGLVVILSMVSRTSTSKTFLASDCHLVNNIAHLKCSRRGSCRSASSQTVRNCVPMFTSLLLLVDVSEKFCMPCNHYPTEKRRCSSPLRGARFGLSTLFICLVCIILQPQARHINMGCFMRPIPRLWRMCSVAFASITITDFIVYPKSLIIDTMPFDSHAPRAAAYNDASTLLLAIFSLCVHMLATCDCRSVSHQRWKN